MAIYKWTAEPNKIFIWGASRTPSGYQEVEYIQSDWNQYIDTWVELSTNFWFEVDFNILDSVSWNWKAVLWWRYTWWNNEINLDTYFWSAWWIFAFWNDLVNPWLMPTTRQQCSLKNLVFTACDGTTTTLSSYTFTKTITLTVFWCRHTYNNTVLDLSTMRLYWLKLYMWNTLVRDFVPCYRKLDSVIWLYDLVNDTFYTNDWAWTFTKWSDVWGKEITKVYLGSNQVRPTIPTYKTYTISWTEQSDMSSWWTYSDDATWMTAGSWDFDDFFWYSAVLLDSSWNEVSEMTQSWWVFTDTMTNFIGNSTDNVMIKFPVRWIKMTKSGSVVTLSITDEPNKAWFQYYAHSTWTLSNPWTPKSAFYLWAYEWYNNSSVLKSWSWYISTNYTSQANFCTYAQANGTWYNIMWYYQRQYINALYMMKYGNPDCQSVIWLWYASSWTRAYTWATNSQTNATYWDTNNYTQIKLFWVEDYWGNTNEWVWGTYTDNSKQLCVQLSWYTWWGLSWWEWTWITTTQTWNYLEMSAISGDNKWMFTPVATVDNGNWNTYYCDLWVVKWWYYWVVWWYRRDWKVAWVFFWAIDSAVSRTSNDIWARLMYL